MDNNWLALIGFRASGKSTLGVKLAQSMALDFYDQDRLVEDREGIRISDIFERKGESYFRNLEEQVLFTLPKTPLVLATGGGFVLNESGMKFLRERSQVAYLRVDVQELIRRRSNGLDQRHLLGGVRSVADEYAANFETRAPLYESYADLVIDWRPDQDMEELLIELRSGFGIK